MSTATTFDLRELGKKGQEASRTLATLPTAKKDEALQAMADELMARSDEVLEANAEDIEDARAEGMDEALVDRLLLTEERVTKLADSLREVTELADPVGSELESRVLPNGMRLSKRRIPIGVVGVIYEARPNVTIDIASDQAPVVGDQVFAMVHVDDGDGEYVFPESDAPFIVDGNAFVVPFTLN
jgi:glutamate-5-semialdehyde dehydrogenase